MRLIDPGCGELSDRLSILALKVLFGVDAGRDVAHFVREQASILAKLRTRDLNGVWFEHYTALCAVNSALWHAEDDLRNWRENLSANAAEAAPKVVKLAFRIQSLNDKRAELIALINKETGDTDGPEKAFAP